MVAKLKYLKEFSHTHEVFHSAEFPHQEPRNGSGSCVQTVGLRLSSLRRGTCRAQAGVSFVEGTGFFVFPQQLKELGSQPR